MLRSVALSCRRGGRRLFQNLSFELVRGQALEVCGANGSGKSSLLRVLAGLAAPASGQVQWDGRPLRAGDPDHTRAVAYLGHLNGLSAELSARENLEFAQRLAGGDTAPVHAALDAWGLAGLATRPVRRLSQGQQRRVALARVAMGRRRLWLLDEPCAGLDTAGERLFAERLQQHLAEGGLAVVATHQPLGLPGALCRPLHLTAPPPRSDTAC